VKLGPPDYITHLDTFERVMETYISNLTTDTYINNIAHENLAEHVSIRQTIPKNTHQPSKLFTQSDTILETRHTLLWSHGNCASNVTVSLCETCNQKILKLGLI